MAAGSFPGHDRLDALSPQNEGLSPPLSSSSLSASSSLLAAPVFPLNGDEFLEQGPGVCLISQDQRHVFLCYKEADSWPSHLENAEFDRLPRYLAASLRARRKDMPQKTRLILCEGRDGTDSSNGDVLIFPDMVRYKGLTHFDVDTFMDEVLVNNREWPSGRPEKLFGTHVFVCSHGSRVPQCGEFGPILIQKFKEEIDRRFLNGHVFVKACSHIGNCKYNGNIIIYSADDSGIVMGHWYAYVALEDVPNLLDEHVYKGHQQHSIELTNAAGGEQQKQDACTCVQLSAHTCQLATRVIADPVLGCSERLHHHHHHDRSFRRKNFKCRKQEGIFRASWCFICSVFERWEKEDTLAVAAVAGAAASVAIAYHLNKRST